MDTALKSAGMVIDGIAASEALDSSGEVLEIEGCDISELEEGRGVLNYEHRGEDAPGASAIDIVGRITFAKKVFKEKDCDNERQRKYWRQIEMPFVYIVGKLFDGVGHSGAQALAAIIRDYKASGEQILVRYSIEGSTLEKKGNRLIRCVARRIALTLKPCNRTCGSDVLEDPNAPDGLKIKPAEKDPLDFEGADKAEGSFTGVLGSFELECDPVMDGQDLEKALSAGVPSGAPSTLTGGAALQVEDRGRRKQIVNQLMAAMRDWGKKPFEKASFKEFIKHRMPEAGDEFIDHFVDIAQEGFDIKRSQLKKEEKEDEDQGPAPVQGRNYARPPALAKPKPTVASGAVKKPLPRLPKKPQEIDEDNADKSAVRIKIATIRGIITKKNKMSGYRFENGILHTPKGSFPLYNPDKGFPVVEHASAVRGAFYKNGVLHVAPGTDLSTVKMNGPNKKAFRDIWDAQEGFHSDKVMPNWVQVHGLLRAGNLPPEVIMHAAIFSMLSPNTPVPVHELMHAHMVDTWEDLGIDPRDPDFIKARRHWMSKDRATNYPRTSPEHFRDNPGGVHLTKESVANGRRVGELMSFMLKENKFSNIAQYHQLHATLVNLVKKHGVDARGATDALMKIKEKHELWKTQRRAAKNELKEKFSAELGLKDDARDYVSVRVKAGKANKTLTDHNGSQLRAQWKAEAKAAGLVDRLSAHAESSLESHPKFAKYDGVLVPGLAPKTGRFTFSMLGGGNCFVPDTHIIRHLFGMDAKEDSDSLAYLKSVLWSPGNHDILKQMDQWYLANHPAAKLMAEHPKWSQYFGNGNTNSPDREQAIFPAFWRHWCCIAADERERKMANAAENEGSTHEPFWEGIRKIVRGAMKLKKGEFDRDLQAKLLGLHAQYDIDHGEIPAQMMYFAHIVPHLLEAAEHRKRHEQPIDFIKTMKLHALDIDLRKATADAHDEASAKDPTVFGVHMKVDGKEHQAGRFMVQGGQLHHLEDYHDLLAHFLPEQPFSVKTVSTIHALKMSPYLRIDREDPPQDADTPSTPVTLPTAPSRPRPPSVFEYQRAGMDKTHTLEVHKGVYTLDGNRLTHPEAGTILSNVRTGAASIRYRSSELGKVIAKMEKEIVALTKGEALDPGSALQEIRKAVQEGHIRPDVERAMTRHIYEDKMTPGIGNKYAADSFLRGGKPGVYVQMDGNDFHDINAAHGHETGDHAIKALGRAAREAMDEAVGQAQGKLFRNPEEQNLYRNGGDEFLAHVPSYEHAAKLMRALGQKLDNAPMIGGTHRLSVSFGVGLDHASADRALYMAKAMKHGAGGNRVHQPGQAPNLGYSLVPGNEGAVPVRDHGVEAMHEVMGGSPPVSSSVSGSQASM